MMGLFNKTVKKGQFTSIASGVRFGSDVTLGDWTHVGSKAVLGNNVVLGNWARIGAGSTIDDNVLIGDHVRLAENVHVGAGSILPGHIRVQAGVAIPANTVLEGHELVTSSGIISNRCSGCFISGNPFGADPITIDAISGRFSVPVLEYDEELIEDYMSGLSDRLEAYRVEAEPEPEMDLEP